MSHNTAILLRVSNPGQHTENQLPDLEAWAERRGLAVAQVYQLQESAWRGAHQKVLTEVYQDARKGRFQVLLDWALDRLSREGPLVLWKSCTGWVGAECRAGRTRSPGPRLVGSYWTYS